MSARVSASTIVLRCRRSSSKSTSVLFTATILQTARERPTTSPEPPHIQFRDMVTSRLSLIETMIRHSQRPRWFRAVRHRSRNAWYGDERAVLTEQARVKGTRMQVLPSVGQGSSWNIASESSVTYPYTARLPLSYAFRYSIWPSMFAVIEVMSKSEVCCITAGCSREQIKNPPTSHR